MKTKNPFYTHLGNPKRTSQDIEVQTHYKYVYHPTKKYEKKK